MTLPVRLVDTTQEHLERLVGEHAQEGPHLEFKRDFQTNWDAATAYSGERDRRFRSIVTGCTA
jgi:hypothetical protein